MPGGYLYEAGVRPGDSILLAEPPEGSVAWASVRFLQGDRSGQQLPLSRRWPIATDYVLFCLGLEFAAAGLWIFLRALDRKPATIFALLAMSAAIAFMAFPAIGNGHPWALALEWVGSKLGMAAFVLFFLTTPLERWRPLRWALALAPLPILSLYGVSVWQQPDLYSVVKPLGYSYMAVSLVVSLLAMVWPFLTGAPRLHRRMGSVLLAASTAAALYLFGSLLPYLLFRRYILPAEVAIAGVGLIPIGFLWAMLHYPILGMSVAPWAMMKTVFDTISDAIFIVRSDGRLMDASRAGLLLLGLRRAREADGELVRMLAGLEVREVNAQPRAGLLLERVLAGERVDGDEIQVRLPNGEAGWVSAVGAPLLDEQGRVEMAVLTYRDITERKHRELEQRELERQKEEFFANVSHDLKTPLSAIKASVGVVLANEPAEMPEPLHRMLVNIDLAADRMAGLVEDLLELERFQAGRIQLRAVPCNLRELTLRAVSTIEPLAAGRDQKVRLELPPGPLVIPADGRRLERALINLLTNAHQYGSSGGTMRVALERQNRDVLFTVADDGPGIPEAERELIFDRFYRAANGVARLNGGSGLGLPIARAAAELHGGRLWVEGGTAKGAIFKMALPVHWSYPDGAKERLDEDTGS